PSQIPLDRYELRVWHIAEGKERDRFSVRKLVPEGRERRPQGAVGPARIPLEVGAVRPDGAVAAVAFDWGTDNGGFVYMGGEWRLANLADGTTSAPLFPDRAE